MLPREEFVRKYGSEKPCLHGSDAHSMERVGEPHGKRYSWIKGAPTFDALRQSCISPERAYTGETPPTGALPSQVISDVVNKGASWTATPAVPLNPGLMTIIGARGSGKTALAELIVAGCDAVPLPLDRHKQSFLYRARDFLTAVSVDVNWASGETDEQTIADAVDDEEFQIKRVQYAMATLLLWQEPLGRRLSVQSKGVVVRLTVRYRTAEAAAFLAVWAPWSLGVVRRRSCSNWKGSDMSFQALAGLVAVMPMPKVVLCNEIVAEPVSRSRRNIHRSGHTTMANAGSRTQTHTPKQPRSKNCGAFCRPGT